MRWLDGIIDTMNMDLSKLRETVKARNVWRAAVHGVTESVGHDRVTEQQQKRIYTTNVYFSIYSVLYSV